MNKTAVSVYTVVADQDHVSFYFLKLSFTLKVEFHLYVDLQVVI